MGQADDFEKLDEWRDAARLEIRQWIAHADPSEKTTHLRRRLRLLNPVRIRAGCGVSEFRIRQLAWRQILQEELAARDAAIHAERAREELSIRPLDSQVPVRHKKERLRLVGRHPRPTR